MIPPPFNSDNVTVRPPTLLLPADRLGCLGDRQCCRDETAQHPEEVDVEVVEVSW
jgi:hypothetical protein